MSARVVNLSDVRRLHVIREQLIAKVAQRRASFIRLHEDLMAREDAILARLTRSSRVVHGNSGKPVIDIRCDDDREGA